MADQTVASLSVRHFLQAYTSQAFAKAPAGTVVTVFAFTIAPKTNFECLFRDRAST
jgi:hypothetical protein